MENEEIIIDNDDDHITVVSDDPEDGIEDLKRQLAEARAAEQLARSASENESRRRLAAEQQTREYATHAGHATAVAQEREYETLIGAISSTQLAIDTATDDYAKAMEIGDYADAAKIQAKLSRMSAQMVNLEAGKAGADDARSKGNRRQSAQPQPAKLDPPDITQPWNGSEMERAIRDYGYSGQTATWIRSNPRFAEDPNFRAQVIGAHQVAVNQGIKPDTDAYFQKIEGIVGVDAPYRNTERVPATQKMPRQQAAVSAPPSRQTSSGVTRGDSQTRVTLNEEQRMVAQQQYTWIEDPNKREIAYARDMLAGIKDGSLDRIRNSRS